MPRQGIPGLVSVIIPAFNAERYLSSAIQSVLAQTYQPLEIIVVNDGSTDGTAEVLSAFSPRLSILTQQNRGLAAARNRGLDVARGEFIAFLDADDAWEPAKIARQVDAFRDAPELMFIHTGRTVTDGDDRVLRALDMPPLEGHCLLRLVSGNVVTASSVMTKAAWLDGQRFDGSVSGTEDWDLWLRLAARGPVGYIAEPLTRYRVHGTNMSNSIGLMLRAMVGTLDRCLERETDSVILAAARKHRHRVLLDIAHSEFEAGAFDDSREWFRRAGPPMERVDLQRYVACFLPSWLRVGLRRIYRTVNAGRRPVAGSVG